MIARLWWYLDPLSPNELNKKNYPKLESLWKKFLRTDYKSFLDSKDHDGLKPFPKRKMTWAQSCLNLKYSLAQAIQDLWAIFIVSSMCAYLIRLLLCDDTFQ